MHPGDRYQRLSWRLRRSWIVTAALGGLLVGAVGLVALRGPMAVRGDADAARQALDQGRFEDARAALERWLQARPNAAEAHYLAARLAFVEGDPRRFHDALERARRLDYPEHALDRLQAFWLVRDRQYAQAEPILVRLAQQPSAEPDPQLLEALARVFLQTYKLHLAAAVLERWRRDVPDDPRPYLWQTEIDRRTQVDPSVIIHHFREALRRDPHLDLARLGLAEELHQQRQTAEAAEHFAIYLDRHPDDVDALVGAGRNALDGDEPEAAASYLDRALALDPEHAEALKQRARLDIRQGRPENALDRLDRALAVQPIDTEALHSRSLVLARLGRHDDARADQQRIARFREEERRLLAIQEQLNHDPENPDLRLQIARWMFNHQQHEAGQRWARSILDRRPDYEPAHRLLAEHYDRQGESGLANYHRLRAQTAPTKSGGPRPPHD